MLCRAPAGVAVRCFKASDAQKPLVNASWAAPYGVKAPPQAGIRRQTAVSSCSVASSKGFPRRSNPQRRQAPFGSVRTLWAASAWGSCQMVCRGTSQLLAASAIKLIEAHSPVAEMTRSAESRLGNLSITRISHARHGRRHRVSVESAWSNAWQALWPCFDRHNRRQVGAEKYWFGPSTAHHIA
mgnify:CR=1 FL=1